MDSLFYNFKVFIKRHPRLIDITLLILIIITGAVGFIYKMPLPPINWISIILASIIMTIILVFILEPSFHFFQTAQWSINHDDSKRNNYEKNFLVLIFIPFTLFFALIFSHLYPYFINSINNIPEILILTLTLLLVYGTFALLIFTYTLVIKSVQNELISKFDIKKESIEQSIIESIKSGLSFLFAATISVMGFILIYVGLLLSKINLGVAQIDFGYNISSWNLIETYYIVTSFIIVVSLFYFFYGLIKIFSSLMAFKKKI